MYGDRSGPGSKPAYYRCSPTSNCDDRCPGINVPAAALEELLAKEVAKILDPNARRRLKRLVKGRCQDRRPKRNSDLQAMKSRLTQLDSRIKRGTENLLVADPDAVKSAGETLRGWRKERKNLANELAKAAHRDKAKLSTADLSRNAERQWKNLADAICSGDDKSSRELFRRVFSRITVHWEIPEGKRNRLITGIQAEYGQAG